MCGIVGWASRDSTPAGGLDRALETLAARGPDGSRTWRSRDGRILLGHARLAILDPSPRAHQPSVEPGGASAFVHNGEVYNFRRLRQRLESDGERFRSDGDGEVAHRLLVREGPEGLDLLEGMFALALWTERDGTLLLARDRFGIKPLYYAKFAGGLAFASQPKALLALPAVSARLDPGVSPTTSPTAMSRSTAASSAAFESCLPLTD